MNKQYEAKCLQQKLKCTEGQSLWLYCFNCFNIVTIDLLRGCNHVWQLPFWNKHAKIRPYFWKWIYNICKSEYFMWSKLIYIRETRWSRIVTKTLSHTWVISAFQCQTPNKNVFKITFKIMSKTVPQSSLHKIAAKKNYKLDFSENKWIQCIIEGVFACCLFVGKVLRYFAKSSSWLANFKFMLLGWVEVVFQFQSSRVMHYTWWSWVVKVHIYDCLRCLNIRWLLCDGKSK